MTDKIKISYCPKCRKKTEDIECGFVGNNRRTECIICRTEKKLDWRNRMFR